MSAASRDHADKRRNDVGDVAEPLDFLWGVQRQHLPTIVDRITIPGLKGQCLLSFGPLAASTELPLLPLALLELTD